MHSCIQPQFDYSDTIFNCVNINHFKLINTIPWDWCYCFVIIINTTVHWFILSTWKWIECRKNALIIKSNFTLRATKIQLTSRNSCGLFVRYAKEMKSIAFLCVIHIYILSKLLITFFYCLLCNFFYCFFFLHSNHLQPKRMNTYMSLTK